MLDINDTFVVKKYQYKRVVCYLREQPALVNKWIDYHVDLFKIIDN
jgi:hypothetical protein